MEIKSKKNNKNNNIVRIIALIVLCFVFCLPLFACNDPIYNHVISVTSSNIHIKLFFLFFFIFIYF